MFKNRESRAVFMPFLSLVVCVFDVVNNADMCGRSVL